MMMREADVKEEMTIIEEPDDITFKYMEGSNYRFLHKLTIEADPKIKEILCVRFDPQDKYCAVGYADGGIRIFNVKTGTTLQHTLTPALSGVKEERMPVSSIRWFKSSGKTANIMLSTSIDGSICHWHATNGKCLNSIRMPGGLDLFCCDIGSGTFCAGGRDHVIRVYDDQSKQLTVELKSGGQNYPGHDNRIFSVKYTENPNILLSAGWDNSIKIWDMRLGLNVGSIYGPHICGDALDIYDDEILSGSYRSKDTLQLFSLIGRELKKVIEWDPESKSEASLVYTAEFNKQGGKLIAAGGGGAGGQNEVRIFDRAQKEAPAGAIYLPRTTLSLDWGNKSDILAMGCADGRLRIVEVVLKENMPEEVEGGMGGKEKVEGDMEESKEGDEGEGVGDEKDPTVSEVSGYSIV